LPEALDRSRESGAGHVDEGTVLEFSDGVHVHVHVHVHVRARKEESSAESVSM
jgi:hypothetical protein